jgi:hypothetical protein
MRQARERLAGQRRGSIPAFEAHSSAQGFDDAGILGLCPRRAAHGRCCLFPDFSSCRLDATQPDRLVVSGCYRARILERCVSEVGCRVQPIVPALTTNEYF